MIARIRKILQIKKLSPSAFADKIGVPRSTMSHILSGRNNPSLDFIKKVLDNFPDIRIQWLVLGQGNMLVNSNTLFSDEEENEESGDIGFSIEENETGEEKTRTESAPELNIPYHDKGSVQKSPSEEVAITGKNTDNTNENENKSGAEGNYDVKNTRKTVRVMIFYSDGSFSEYYPSVNN